MDFQNAVYSLAESWDARKESLVLTAKSDSWQVLELWTDFLVWQANSFLLIFSLNAGVTGLSFRGDLGKIL